MSERECDRCKGWPCVCHYVEKIGAEQSSRAELARALTKAGRDRPHFFPWCPCVECYRVRYSSWEVSS